MPTGKTLPHWCDRDCQGFLVDDVHLLPDAQAADEGLDLGVPRRDCSLQVVRADEADRIGCRINFSDRYAATTDTRDFATWPTSRLRAADRHVFKWLARRGKDVHHLGRKCLIVGHGYAVAWTDLVEALH